MIYGGRYLVLWQKAKNDKRDALMWSFDTMIEGK